MWLGGGTLCGGFTLVEFRRDASDGSSGPLVDAVVNNARGGITILEGCGTVYVLEIHVQPQNHVSPLEWPPTVTVSRGYARFCIPSSARVSFAMQRRYETRYDVVEREI